jgi:hypothetical protein
MIRLNPRCITVWWADGSAWLFERDPSEALWAMTHLDKPRGIVGDVQTLDRCTSGVVAEYVNSAVVGEDQ